MHSKYLLYTCRNLRLLFANTTSKQASKCVVKSPVEQTVDKRVQGGVKAAKNEREDIECQRQLDAGERREKHRHTEREPAYYEENDADEEADRQAQFLVSPLVRSAQSATVTRHVTTTLRFAKRRLH